MKTYILTEDTPIGKKGDEFTGIAVGSYLKERELQEFILLKLGVLKEKEERKGCGGCKICDTSGCKPGICACHLLESDPTPEDTIEVVEAPREVRLSKNCSFCGTNPCTSQYIGCGETQAYERGLKEGREAAVEYIRDHWSEDEYTKYLNTVLETAKNL